MFASHVSDRLWLWMRREIRWRWLSVLLLLVTGWFAWHALHGQRGLYAWLDAKRELTVLEGQLAELEARRDVLKHQQDLLAGEVMDADMVEEKLLALGWIRQGDRLLPDPPPADPQH